MAGRKTSNAVEILKKKIIGKDREKQAQYDAEYENAKIARKIYDLRTEAKLTQKQLADLIGTKQSVISRLEDADYDGHSFAMLRRIADALGYQLVVDMKKKPTAVQTLLNRR